MPVSAVIRPAIRRSAVAVLRSPEFRYRAATASVLALAAAFFFARLGDRALWSMELRWAEIPREMVLSGDYFRPTINGHLYYDKPLGSYWLVLAASWFTGTLDEATARLPSAIAGLLGVILVIDLGRRLFDRRTGVLAGLILATSFGYVGFARTASADTETVAGTVAAVALFVRCEKRPHRWWVVGLWTIMAVTSLTKGLLGFALPLVVLITDAALAGIGSLRDRVRWLCGRQSMIAAGAAALIYTAPFALSGSSAEQGLFMVFRENVQRFFDPVNHRGPMYLYAYVIFGLMAPWSLLLPAAFARSVAAWRGGFSRGDRFAAAYLGATFLFFTLARSRRSYYLLPVLPAAALLIARLLSVAPAELSTVARRLITAGFGVFTASVVLAGAALLPAAWLLARPWSDLPPLPAAAGFALGWLGCLGLLAWAWRSASPPRLTAAFAGAAALTMAYLYLIAVPAADAYRDEKPFAARIRARLGGHLDGLALYQTRQPVFYVAAPGPLAEFETADELRAAIQSGSVRWLLGRARDLAPLGPVGHVVDAEPTHPWETSAERTEKLQLLRAEKVRENND
jgi:4-amino-4-deoxy-L-arabinose transferase-like glycosyltransferase